jgi:hypothetical protein
LHPLVTSSQSPSRKNLTSTDKQTSKDRNIQVVTRVMNIKPAQLFSQQGSRSRAQKLQTQQHIMVVTNEGYYQKP